MRPQKAQMQMAEHDRLDAAIDQVAARMTAVPDDDQLTQRIVASLPERSSRFRLRAARFGGQVGWLIPQFAAITAFAIAAVVWTLRDPVTPPLLPSSDVVAVMAVPNTVVAFAPGTVFRTRPLESAFARLSSGELRRDRPLEHLEPVEPLDGDFDRSLPPIEAMSALVVSDLDPDALPGAPALVLAPIAITELPLTAESFSPR